MWKISPLKKNQSDKQICCLLNLKYVFFMCSILCQQKPTSSEWNHRIHKDYYFLILTKVSVFEFRWLKDITWIGLW